MTVADRPMFRVKICGHTRASDIDASIAAGADAIGVISAVPVETPRAVPDERGAALLEQVPNDVTGVLVTMPDDSEHAVRLIDRLAPDVLQLHGPLSMSTLESIASSIEQPIVKSATSDDPDRIRAYASVADAILLDSRSSDGAGGTGRPHDWDRARSIAASLDVPTILAGGLAPATVREAIHTARPYGVDVASGVETSGGVKDHAAVERFVAAAREGLDLEVSEPCT